MSSLTSRSKKSTSETNKGSKFHLKCKASGLFLANATAGFETISVTMEESRAAWLCGDEIARYARMLMRTFYGSFDWQLVPVEV